MYIWTVLLPRATKISKQIRLGNRVYCGLYGNNLMHRDKTKYIFHCL